MDAGKQGGSGAGKERCAPGSLMEGRHRGDGSGYKMDSVHDRRASAYSTRPIESTASPVQLKLAERHASLSSGAFSAAWGVCCTSRPIKLPRPRRLGGAHTHPPPVPRSLSSGHCTSTATSKASIATRAPPPSVLSSRSRLILLHPSDPEKKRNTNIIRIQCGRLRHRAGRASRRTSRRSGRPPCVVRAPRYLRMPRFCTLRVSPLVRRATRAQC